MEIFRLNNVTFQYSNQSKVILDNISLDVKAGDFLVLCGPSGCGKTTLLRLLKRELAPIGEKSGEILYLNKALEQWGEKSLVEQIAFVMQDPDNQIIMDEVIQEIVFALENLGYSNFEMRKRVAEMVHFFGIEGLLRQKPSELSGGQKQMINLLSALLLKPNVLLLDEPTSQLDPIAAKELITMLERLNKEMGLTIIIVEHRLEELFDIADRIYMMDNGKFVYEGSSQRFIQNLYEKKEEVFISYLPSIARLYMELEQNPVIEKTPLTVKKCREWIRSKRISSKRVIAGTDDSQRRKDNPLLEIKDVFFQYDKKAPLVLKNFNFQLGKGEFVAVVGGNGSGKTTMLKLCIGSVRPQRGKVRIKNVDTAKLKGKKLYEQMAYLPQNPRAYFVHHSIEKEMRESIARHQIVNGEEEILKLLQAFDIEQIRFSHPHDLSGGEIQRAALASMLIGNPEILFIDEPTKGLDPVSKKKLLQILKQLNESGVTILMVTHDIEFAAQSAKRCVMMFDGEITVDGTPNQLFKGNYFYTTTINRATRLNPLCEVLTLEEALETWQVLVNT